MPTWALLLLCLLSFIVVVGPPPAFLLDKLISATKTKMQGAFDYACFEKLHNVKAFYASKQSGVSAFKTNRSTQSLVTNASEHCG